MESLHPDKRLLGVALSPSEEAVRFSVKSGLIFPPSDISDLRDQNEEDRSIVEMEIAFMGLTGPSGLLPHWYTDLQTERIREKDFSLKAFFDLFHHRFVSLFYLAWKKHRLAVNYLPGATDRHSSHFLSLIGLGTPGLSNSIGYPNEPLIFCSGHLSQIIPSVASIEATVEYFTSVRTHVEQFIDRMISVAPKDRTQFGMANGQLGVDAMCGSYAWESQTKFRVELGPMGFARFAALLPSGNELYPIFSLIRYMVGIEYEFEVGLVLKKEEVPACVLGMPGINSPQLGWTTWVKSPGVDMQDDPLVIFQES